MGELAARLARSTSGKPLWVAAAVVACLGGAAAGLQLPTGGDTFVHIATAQSLGATGFGGFSAFMTGGASALDLRSWLLDLWLSSIYAAGGVGLLELFGALLGAGTGLLMVLAVRLHGRAHPVMVLVGLGLTLAALGPAAPATPALVLAGLTACLMVCLAGIGEGRSWAGYSLILLIALWANVNSSVLLVVPIVVVFLLLDRRQKGDTTARVLLPLLVVAASLANPRGPAIYAGLPYSLGMFGEHPLLAAWSSPDFHPWGARLSELTALALLLGYLVAHRQGRVGWGYLALTSAVMALLWSSYLPLFLVVAGVQSASLLSEWASAAAERAPIVTAPHSARRGLLLVAAAPALLSVGLLGLSSAHSLARGGPAQQLARQLPVAASTWLTTHRLAGSWYTTPDFGDYLAARFTNLRELVCTSDPVADGQQRMLACQRMAALNKGALGVLRSLGARAAVLPAAAPAVAFLTAQGWVVRYRDSTTVVLTAFLSSS